MFKKFLFVFIFASLYSFAYADDPDTYTIPIGTKCHRQDPYKTRMHCTEACKNKGFERGICKVPHSSANTLIGRCYCRYY